MSELNSTNQWIYHCGVDPNRPRDLDYRVIWGNNGTLTIQRNYLRKIIYKMQAYNPKEGWVEKSDQRVLASPTSEPVTFENVLFLYPFALGETENYWGRPYTIKGLITVVHGPDNLVVDEEVITTVNGCFTMRDPNYFEYYQGCILPDVGCELPDI
jgi:hypothetical protein